MVAAICGADIRQFVCTSLTFIESNLTAVFFFRALPLILFFEFLDNTGPSILVHTRVLTNFFVPKLFL